MSNNPRVPERPGGNLSIEDVCCAYCRYGSIKRTAAELGIWHGTVKKCLITAGIIDDPHTGAIVAAQSKGLSLDEISEQLGISRYAVFSLAPYTSGTYLTPSTTPNAARIRRCRENKRISDE